MNTTRTCTDRRDAAYLEILKHGLIAIRNAAAAGNVTRCQAEAEHLHNIPALIGFTDASAHRYYLGVARTMFLEWVLAQKDGALMRHVHSVYLPFWQVLEEELGDVGTPEHTCKET